MVNDEYRQGIKSDFSITETDDAYTVKLGSPEYTVSKDVNECSCLCFSNFGLPCKHIFACRRKKNMIFDRSQICLNYVRKGPNVFANISR